MLLRAPWTVAVSIIEALAPDDTLSTATAAVIRTTQHEFPVLGSDGALLGFVTRAALFEALAHDAPRTRPVTEIMTADIPRVALATGLETVLATLHDGAPAIAVCTETGQMLGYITRENVGELMVVQGR